MLTFILYKAQIISFAYFKVINFFIIFSNHLFGYSFAFFKNAVNYFMHTVLYLEFNIFFKRVVIKTS